MARRRQVVRLGIPALIVAGLAIVALWRVGAPVPEPSPVGTAGSPAVPAAPKLPLTTVPDLLAENASGRRASLEAVTIREITSPRTFWIGARDEERAFVVLDPDVKRTGEVTLAPGARVALTGLVRPAPAAAQAIQQWRIDEATAAALLERGTYLHATEIRQLPTSD